MSRVFVTGMGIISAIGNNLEENLSQLKEGKSGISKAQFLKSKFVNTHHFGEAKISTAALRANLNIYDKSFTRTDLLAFSAFEEAIKNANLSAQEISSGKTAFISASTIGGMQMTQELYNDANLLSKNSDLLESYPGHTHAQKFAKHFELSGIVDVINTACSSSANAIMNGTRLIKSGKINRAIVGGTDSLGKFTVNGFNSLGIMSETPCRPFDENRNGLNLGEGAAYLILESEEIAGNKEKYGEVLGYGNSNDAYHPSSLSDEAIGVVIAMEKALKIANLSADKIDYISAHGTATGNNDYTELTGIQKTFNRFPPFNSTKSYTGHTLAAAGAIEAVYSILSILHQELYPSLNFEEAIIPYNQKPIEKYKSNVPIKHVMSNSFGFAGNCTSLIISKI